MEKLVTLIKMLVDRAPWTSETDHQSALDLLREAEGELNLSTSVVGPPAGTREEGDQSAPPQRKPDLPPEAVATLREAGWTETSSGWTPPAAPAGFVPPTSPEVTAAPEEANAFAPTQP